MSTTLIMGILVFNIGSKILQSELHEFDFSVEASPSVVDVGEAVSFRLTSIEGAVSQFIFDFHDGTPPVTVDPVTTTVYHAFAIEGGFLVSVTGIKAVGELGRVLTHLKVVAVTVQNEGPTVTFELEKSEVWEDEVVPFSVTSIVDSPGDVAAMQYQWLFGDGQSANGSAVTHTYTEAGTYEVTLQAIDDQGLVGMSSRSLRVENVLPSATMQVNATESTEDQTVVFDAQETTDSPSDVGSLLFGWNFGDGTLGSGPTVQHQYTEEGIYQVRLTVRDPSGGQAEVSTVITVENQLPFWSQIELNRTLLPEGQTLISHSQGQDTPSDQPRLSYRWFLENKRGQTVSWTYFDEQDLRVTGTLTDDNGASVTRESHVTFYNVAPSASLVATTLTFNLTLLMTGEKWHDAELKLLDETDQILLNDIIYRNATNPWNQSLFYPFVTLDLTHLWRVEVLYTPENDPVNGQPQGADPVHLYLNFSTGSSWLFEHTFNYNSPEGYLWRLPLQPFVTGFPIDYHINFYDPGQDDLTLEVIHPTDQVNLTILASTVGPNQGVTILTQNFAMNDTPPYFLLTFRILDEDGGSRNSTYLFEAPFGPSEGYHLAGSAPRIQAINSSIDRGVGQAWEDELITFDAQVLSSPIDQQLLVYHWQFGDGTTQITASPRVTHTFVTAGLYLVELTVQGAQYNTTRGILVEVDNVRPTGYVEHALGQSIEVGSALVFNASTSSDSLSDRDSLRFIWDFGDGDSHSGYSALTTHRYYHSGVYRGTLTILDDNAANDTVEFVVWVQNPAPQIQLAAQIQMNEGVTTLIEAQVTDSAFQVPYLAYQWQIDDIYVSQSRLNLFLNDGSYHGILTVTDSEGRQTSQGFQIIVNNQLPKVSFTPHLIYGSAPSAFRIHATAIDTVLDYQALQFRYAITNAMNTPLELLENQAWHSVTDGKILLDLDLSSLTHGQHTLLLQVKDPSNVGAAEQHPLVVFWDDDGDSVSNVLEAQLGTDETLADTDDDWIVDSQESTYGTDPARSDTDNDGLWDGYQASTGIGEFLVNTDPTDDDTDDDSLQDGLEVYGWNITVLLQGSSTAYHTQHVFSNPLLTDTDHDGLTDAKEYEARSNPQATDTDSDGLTDYEEYIHGTPLTAAYSRTTLMDASLSIDREAPENDPPWTIEFNLAETLKKDPPMLLDRQGGSLVATTHRVNIYDASNNLLAIRSLDTSGKGRYSYETYQSQIRVEFPGNGLYYRSETSVSPAYDAKEMIQNVGPENTAFISSNAFNNARFKIFRAYIEDSGAFSKSGNTYTMVADYAHIYHDVPFGIDLVRGYEVTSPVVSFTKDELESGLFDTTTIAIRQYDDWLGINWSDDIIPLPIITVYRVRTPYDLSKTDFLTLWLSMKLRPWRREHGPEDPGHERLTYVNQLAADLVTLLNYNKQQLEANPEFVASVYGRLNITTRLGFPDAKSGIEQFFEDLVNFIGALIAAALLIVAAIITTLVGLAVGVVNFLLNVWDQLIAPALGSVVEVIKEVAVTTVKVVLTIMTQALTGELPIIGIYKNYVKEIFLNIFENTDWTTIIQRLEASFSSVNLKEVIKPLATNVATMLGPADSFYQTIKVAQQVFAFPGIIQDLLSLIGPDLVFTLVSEFLKITITTAFKALIVSWGNNNIISFSNILNLESWGDQHIDSFIELVENFSSPGLENIITFSGIIHQLGSLENILNFSLWGDLLTFLMTRLRSASQNLIFKAFFDLSTTFIGGLLYLINPTAIFPTAHQTGGRGSFSSVLSNSPGEHNHSTLQKLTSISIFLFTAILSRSYSVIATASEVGELLAFVMDIESVFWATLNWAYVGGNPLLNLPGSIISEYGVRFNYLGANVLSFLFNQIGTMLGSFFEIPIVEQIFEPRVEKKTSLKWNQFKAIFSNGLQIVAAIATMAGIIFPIFGPETAVKHFLNDDPVLAGDILFFLQAGILHLLVNADRYEGKRHGREYGFINWDNIPSLKSPTKRSLILFGIGTFLDLGMAAVFMLWAE
ncbi:MAG: PKD domain-containing protein [Candidatus Thorarchaeota archaeon]